MASSSVAIRCRFPDAQRAIPQQYAHFLTIAREPWLKALQRAAILSSEKFRSVRCLVQPGQMTLISNNAERDEAEEGVAIAYDGAGLEISFDTRYLLDQAVRIPKDMQFEGVTVLEIRRDGDTILLRPARPNWASFAGEPLADSDFLSERPAIFGTGRFDLSSSDDDDSQETSL